MESQRVPAGALFTLGGEDVDVPEVIEGFPQGRQPGGMHSVVVGHEQDCHGGNDDTSATVYGAPAGRTLRRRLSGRGARGYDVLAVGPTTHGFTRGPHGTPRRATVSVTEARSSGKDGRLLKAHAR